MHAFQLYFAEKNGRNSIGTYGDKASTSPFERSQRPLSLFEPFEKPLRIGSWSPRFSGALDTFFSKTLELTADVSSLPVEWNISTQLPNRIRLNKRRNRSEVTK